MVKNLSAVSFTQFLVEREPVYDEMILKTIRPDETWLKPMRRDVRFLPNEYRGLWTAHKFHKWKFSQIGRRLKLKSRTVRRRFYVADEMVVDRVKAWLKTLSRRRRKRERDMRRDGWFLKVDTGDWSKYATVNSTLQRFNHVWPDVTSGWKQTAASKDKILKHVSTGRYPL